MSNRSAAVRPDRPRILATLALTTAAGALLGLLVAWSAPPVFEARTQVMLSNGHGDTIVRSDAVLAGALQAAATEPGARNVDFASMTVADLRERLTVAPTGAEGIVGITVSAGDPQMAARLANAVAGSLVREQSEADARSDHWAAGGSQSRLDTMKTGAIAAQTAVDRYRTEHGLDALAQREDETAALDARLRSGRREAADLQTAIDRLAAFGPSQDLTGIVANDLATEAMNARIGTVNERQQALDTLKVALGPKHPDRIAAEGALRGAKDALASEIAGVLVNARADLAAVKARNASLETRMAKASEDRLAKDDELARLRDLEATAETRRAAYDALVVERRFAGLSVASVVPGARIATRATPPLSPSGPVASGYALAGGFAGLFAGLAAAMVGWLRRRGIAERKGLTGALTSASFDRVAQPRALAETKPLRIAMTIRHEPEPEAVALAPTIIDGTDLRPSRSFDVDAMRYAPAPDDGVDLSAIIDPPVPSGTAMSVPQDDPREAIRALAAEGARVIEAVGEPESGAANAQLAQVTDQIADLRRQLVAMRRSRRVVPAFDR